MRGLRLKRLIQIIAMLRGPQSWNARRLAEAMHTSIRNVYRDLAVLELAGVPYHYDPDYGEGGGYRIAENYFFPHIGLTDQECLDIAVLTQLAEQQGIPLLGDACFARDKLFGTLPAKQQSLIAEASALFDILSFRLPDQGRCRKIMLALQGALLAKRQVEGIYRGGNDAKAKQVSIQPRRIFLGNGIWYMIAHDNKDGQTKLFRLSRFVTARASGEADRRKRTVQLARLFGKRLGRLPGARDYHVEIRFSAEAAPLVEECHWHQTQEIEHQPDGSLLFRATVSGLEEIRYWVLTWGPRATVPKPLELVEEIKRLAESVLAQYAGPIAKRHPRRKD